MDAVLMNDRMYTTNTTSFIDCVYNYYLVKDVGPRKCSAPPDFLRMRAFQWLLFRIRRRWIHQQRLAERTPDAIRFLCFTIFQSIASIEQPVRFTSGTLLQQSVVSDAMRSHQLCFYIIESTLRNDVHAGHMERVAVTAAPSLGRVHVQVSIAVIVMIIRFDVICSTVLLICCRRNAWENQMRMWAVGNRKCMTYTCRGHLRRWWGCLFFSMAETVLQI